MQVIIPFEDVKTGKVPYLMVALIENVYGSIEQNNDKKHVIVSLDKSKHNALAIVQKTIKAFLN